MVWTVAATLFCVALGSSSVAGLAEPGRKLRWAALLALACASALLALRSRGAPPSLWRLGALAGWLAAVAVVSTAWSVAPRLTFERAGSFVLMLVAALSLAVVVADRERFAVRLLAAIVAAVAAVAVAGLLVLLFRRDASMQWATYQTPARYRGLGENPDTMSMLEAVAAPAALWFLVRGPSRRVRAAGAAALLLSVGSIVASGSRGALLAALVGGLVISLALRAGAWRRVALAVAVAAVVFGGAVITRIPKPLAQPAAAQKRVAQAPPQKKPVVQAPAARSPAQTVVRLADELDRPDTVGAVSRPLFGSSGRIDAWVGALGQADERPLLGYGFGTEEKVFVDRYYTFQGSYVENSFIGLYLQLGAVGLVAFLAFLLTAVAATAGAVRRAGDAVPAAALAGVLGAGIAMMAVQSFAYSVGNVATLTVWVGALGGAALAGAGRRTAHAGLGEKEMGVVAT